MADIRNQPEIRNPSDIKVDYKYAVDAKSLSNQFHHLYFARLKSLKFSLEKAAVSKWGDKSGADNIPHRKLSEVTVEERCVVIGVLYKTMEKKIRALDFLSDGKRNFEKRKTEEPKNLTSDNDTLFFEEQTGRVELKGLDPADWTTGFFIALLGRLDSDSKFVVEDYTLAGLPMQRTVGRRAKMGEKKSFVSIISGINFGGKETDFASLSLLIDFFNGEFGSERLKKLSSQISCIIVAGNLFSQIFEPLKIDPLFDDEDNEINNTRIEQIRQLDLLLSRLASTVPLYLMGGEFDPTNQLIPQQPMHRFLFPKCSTLSSFSRQTNPFAFEVAGARFLGTSGQNLADLRRCSHLGELQALEKCLLNRALFPTAPDTLACAPFELDDPLLLRVCPEVFFAGNAERFSTRRVVEGIKEAVLVTVPVFSEAGSLVMVDESSLEASEVRFEAAGDDDGVE